MKATQRTNEFKFALPMWLVAKEPARWPIVQCVHHALRRDHEDKAATPPWTVPVRPDTIDVHHALATEAPGSPADPSDDATTGISCQISQENIVPKVEPFGERPKVCSLPDVAPDEADCRRVGVLLQEGLPPQKSSRCAWRKANKHDVLALRTPHNCGSLPAAEKRKVARSKLVVCEPQPMSTFSC
jgi:hypothetical protein